MTKDQKLGYLAAGVMLALFAMLLFIKPVKAQSCPPDAKSCKVVVLTAEQENVLDQLVTNTCVQGPYQQIHEVVKFYKELLAKAPAGVAPPDKPADVRSVPEPKK